MAGATRAHGVLLPAVNELEMLATKGCKLLDRVTYPRDPVFGGFGFGGRSPAVTGADLLAAPGLAVMFIKKAGVLAAGACIGHGMVMRRLDTHDTDGAFPDVIRFSAPLPFRMANGLRVWFEDDVCAYSSDEQVFGIHIGLFAGYTIVDSLALLKSERCVSSFLQDKQFVVGVEAGVHLGEDGLTLGPLAKGSAAAEAALAGVAGTCKRTQQVQVFTAARHGLLADVAVKVSVLSRDDELIEQVYGSEVAAHPERVLDGTVAAPVELQKLYSALKYHLPKWEMMWRAWKLSRQSAASTSQNLPDGAASISEGFGPATEESTSGTAA